MSKESPFDDDYPVLRMPKERELPEEHPTSSTMKDYSACHIWANTIYEIQKRIVVAHLHNALVKSCPVGTLLSSLRDSNDMVNKQDFIQVSQLGLKFCTNFCPSNRVHKCEMKHDLFSYIDLVTTGVN